MTKHGRYSASLAVAFVSVYFVNLAYLKLLAADIVDPIGGFDGLEPVPQVIILLLMSIFFVVFVIGRQKREERERGMA